MAIKATIVFRNRRAKNVYVNREFNDKKHIERFINYALREWDNFISYALKNWDNITVCDEVYYDE